MSGRRVSFWLTTAAAAVLAVVVVWPQALGLSGSYGPAQVVAMRGLTVAGGLGAVIVLVPLALLIRPARWHLAAVAVLVAAATAFSAGIVLARGLAGDDPPTTGPAGDRAAGEVRVLAFNTLFDGAGPAAVADLVTAHEADVVVLPETSAATTRQAAELAGGGFQVFHHQVDAGITSATGLLVASSLGRYDDPEPDPSGGLGSFTVRPLETGDEPEPPGGGPPITAVHAWPPTGDAMPRWRADTGWAVDQCTSMDGAIVAGDFNATLDHPALRSLGHCVDAAAARDAAAVGTWPASWPSWAGAPIDHVLADARSWDVVSFSVLDPVGGSDHRPVLAVLRPAGSG